MVAYDRGGALETVTAADGGNWDTATGLFFCEQTPQTLLAAVRQFLQWEGCFRPEILHRDVERFSRERLRREIESFVAGERRN